MSVMVDGKMVKAEDSIELLSVSFDRKLTTKPHAQAMLVAVKQRAAVIARLVNHIPRGKYLRQLAMGLVNGKLGHALAAYATSRLPAPSGEAENPPTLYHQIQVAYNRVRRSITGVKIRDRVLVPDLLERAGMPSVNGMVVNAVAMETWNCRHSSTAAGTEQRTLWGPSSSTRARRSRPPARQRRGGRCTTERQRHLCVQRGEDVELVGGPEGGDVKVVCKISCKKSCSEISFLVSKVAYLAKDPVDATREVANLARFSQVLGTVWRGIMAPRTRLVIGSARVHHFGL
jgi:hypothetical protein